MSSLAFCTPSLHRVALAALLALASCSRRDGAKDDDDEGCVCRGALPEGGRLDVECGSTACVAGVGYRCVEADRAVIDQSACDPEAGRDAAASEPDAGSDGETDAAIPADLCHSVGYSCVDGPRNECGTCR